MKAPKSIKYEVNEELISGYEYDSRPLIMALLKAINDDFRVQMEEYFDCKDGKLCEPYLKLDAYNIDVQGENMDKIEEERCLYLYYCHCLLPKGTGKIVPVECCLKIKLFVYKNQDKAYMSIKETFYELKNRIDSFMPLEDRMGKKSN